MDLEGYEHPGGHLASPACISCVLQFSPDNHSGVPQSKWRVPGDLLKVHIGAQKLGLDIETGLGDNAVNCTTDGHTFTSE
jgi:hypothetical protein